MSDLGSDYDEEEHAAYLGVSLPLNGVNYCYLKDFLTSQIFASPTDAFICRVYILSAHNKSNDVSFSRYF